MPEHDWHIFRGSLFNITDDHWGTTLFTVYRTQPTRALEKCRLSKKLELLDFLFNGGWFCPLAGGLCDGPAIG